MENVHLEISGRNVVINKFGAIEGWKILRRLLAVLGPALERGTFGTGNAAETLFQKLPEGELIALLKRLTAYVIIDNKPCNFELDMKVGSFSFDVINEVIKLNFEDFFSKIKGMWAGFQEESTQDTPNQSQTMAP